MPQQHGRGAWPVRAAARGRPASGLAALKVAKAAELEKLEEVSSLAARQLARLSQHQQRLRWLRSWASASSSWQAGHLGQRQRCAAGSAGTEWRSWLMPAHSRLAWQVRARAAFAAELAAGGCGAHDTPGNRGVLSSGLDAWQVKRPYS